MRILLTNDDGIHAPGLAVLETIAARTFATTFSSSRRRPTSRASPIRCRSAIPLRLREISPRHYAVKGTPTDCVIMGVRQIMADKRPDLVLSGVNRGQNVAEDVTYSGTIAGAMEGAMLGVPVDRPVAGLCRRARAAGDRMGSGRGPRGPADSPDSRGRHRARRPRQRQLSALRRRRGRRESPSPGRDSATPNSCGSSSGATAAGFPITG